MQKYAEKLKSQHKNIKFEIDCRREFNLETSMPLAMLINELLKRSINKKPTEIKIEIKKHKKRYQLIITNNGTFTGGDRKPPYKSTNPTT